MTQTVPLARAIISRRSAMRAAVIEHGDENNDEQRALELQFW
jgi:hypothetical protein